MRKRRLCIFLIILIFLILIVRKPEVVFVFIEKTIQFFIWLFTISMTNYNVSILEEILIKSLTFVISYFLVGAIFNCLNWFNKRIMKTVYFIFSTLIGFGFNYGIMLLQKYAVIIIWVILFIMVALFFVYFIYYGIVKKGVK